MRSSYRSVKPYVTKDGSQIRELMHPSVHGNRNQSVAEATVPARGKTALHLHQVTEEIYHITRGAGMSCAGCPCVSTWIWNARHQARPMPC